MINSGKLEVEVNISSSDYLKRDSFTEFNCHVDVLGNRTYPLDLIAINQKANMNQLYLMRLSFREGLGKQSPTPGMTTMVSIEYNDGNSGKVSVPLSSVLEKNGESYVWIYNKETSLIKACKVKASEVLLNGTVILSEGPKPGDIVITAGIHSLKEGEKVTPLPASSSTNIGGLL